jgi:hypothetical protein
MFSFRRACGVVVSLTGLGAAFACSPADKGSKGVDPNLGMSAKGGTGASGGSGGAGGTIIAAGGGGGDVIAGGMGQGAIAGTGGPETCADMITPGMAVPVDVYVMLDISGSMVDPDPTKWAAVKSALGAFFADPTSAGLNVAVQYFPLRNPGVPATCSTDAECGAAAPCLLNICQQIPGVLVTCTPGADAADTTACANAVLRDDGPCTDGACHLSGKACADNTACQTIEPALGRCVQYGSCEADATLSCGVTNPGKPQAGCGANGASGLCLPATTSFCAHETVCDPDSYKVPAVDYLTLPDSANALMTSIGAQMPAGDTPSRPALRGAIAHAREHAAANVGHSEVVLFATDGLPTDCTGGRSVSGVLDAALDDTVAVATEGFTPAKAGDSRVTTFVIGVFSDVEKDTARTNLDRIAKAGGSTESYVVTSGADVQQKFLEALAQIRESRLGCEYQIPPAPVGQKLDYGLVNVKVKHTDGSPDEGLFNVLPTACSGMADEWHYDCNVRDPAAMCKPTKIIACPKTCEALVIKTNASGVNVGLGCKTNIR